MSGHNKWSKIKNKKAVTDAKKSQIFSKLVKLIQVESRLSHGNVESPGLRSAIIKAKEANMPSDNIERAVKKGAGGEGAELIEAVYETYGPGGVAVMIEVLTDSKNRASAEIKHILSKNGYALAAPGSCSWAFHKEGKEWIPQTTVEISEEDGTKLEEFVEELENNDDVQEIFHNAS